MIKVVEVEISDENGTELKSPVKNDIETITNHCLSDFPYDKNTKIDLFFNKNGVKLNILPTGFKNLIITSLPTSFDESLGYPATEINGIGNLDFVYMDCSKLTSGSLLQFETLSPLQLLGERSNNPDYGLFERCYNLDFDGSKSLTIGGVSFKNTLVSLKSLVIGANMFRHTSISKFDYDLSKLKCMRNMFEETPLKEFKSNLYSLTQSTFTSYQIKEILCSLSLMFYPELLLQFLFENGVIEENEEGLIIDGVKVTEDMPSDYIYTLFINAITKIFPEYINFIQNNFSDEEINNLKFYALTASVSSAPFIVSDLETFTGDMPVMEYGYGMFSGTNLKNYVGDLSSLKSGFGMFGRKSFNDYGLEDIYEKEMGQPSLNSDSVFNIIHSIPNREENAPQPTDILEMILEDGVISIAIDSTEENSNEFAKEIGYETFEELNQHFLEKGWYVDWIFNPATTSYGLRRVEKTILRDYYDIKEINTSILPESFRETLKKDISIKDIYKNDVYKSKTDGKHYIILTSKFKTQHTDESLENIKDVIKKYNLEKI